jgi:hypothetical protein
MDTDGRTSAARPMVHHDVGIGNGLTQRKVNDMKYSLQALLILGFAGSALAQGLPSFEEVDTNSDGQISQEEAAAIEGLDFATADANQDGTLSMEEYHAAQAE